MSLFLPDQIDICVWLIYFLIALVSSMIWLLLAGVGVLIYKIVRCFYV